LFISGVQERLSLYEQLGFEQIGQPVQGGKAVFVPMVVSLSNIAEKKRRAMQLWIKRLAKRGTDGEPAGRGAGDRGREAEDEPERAPASPSCGQKVVCLLPGPVTIAPEVHAAFHRMPIYHRGPDFMALFEKVRGQLARMVNCRNVAIFNGSGTLGNEV